MSTTFSPSSPPSPSAAPPAAPLVAPPAAPPLPGLPEGVCAADLDRGAVHLEVDDALYPLEAVYGAAYTFIDRCYVLLDRPAPGRLRVTLQPKRGATDGDTLGAWAGELGNELLACAWRHTLVRDNRAAIEAVTARAIGGAMGPPSLDDLAAFDFSSEALEDPLGIATSWEEKYRKRKPKAEAEGEAETATEPSGGGTRDGGSENDDGGGTGDGGSDGGEGGGGTRDRGTRDRHGGGAP